MTTLAFPEWSPREFHEMAVAREQLIQKLTSMVMQSTVDLEILGTLEDRLEGQIVELLTGLARDPEKVPIGRMRSDAAIAMEPKVVHMNGYRIGGRTIVLWGAVVHPQGVRPEDYSPRAGTRLFMVGDISASGSRAFEPTNAPSWRYNPHFTGTLNVDGGVTVIPSTGSPDDHEFTLVTPSDRILDLFTRIIPEQTNEPA